MKEYIKKLQSKSEDTRKLIMIVSMVLSMSFVSFIWIYNLGTRFGNPQIAEKTNEDIKPFKLFTNSISSTYKNMSASIGKVSSSVNEAKNEIKKIPENTETKTEKQIDLIPVEYSN